MPAAKIELWPAAYAEDQLPESLPLTVAFFAIAVYAVAQLATVRQITRITGRYFNATETEQARN